MIMAQVSPSQLQLPGERMPSSPLRTPAARQNASVPRSPVPHLRNLIIIIAFLVNKRPREPRCHFQLNLRRPADAAPRLIPTNKETNSEKEEKKRRAKQSLALTRKNFDEPFVGFSRGRTKGEKPGGGCWTRQEAQSPPSPPSPASPSGGTPKPPRSDGPTALPIPRRGLGTPAGPVRARPSHPAGRWPCAAGPPPLRNYHPLWPPLAPSTDGGLSRSPRPCPPPTALVRGPAPPGRPSARSSPCVSPPQPGQPTREASS